MPRATRSTSGSKSASKATPVGAFCDLCKKATTEEEYATVLDQLKAVKLHLAASGLLLSSPEESREVLEAAAITAARFSDVQTFDLQWRQLQAASASGKVVALQLLRLLLEHRHGDFHSALERVPAGSRDTFVQWVLSLETAVLDGQYAKALSLSSGSSLPDGHDFAAWGAAMQDSIRSELLESISSSYRSLPLKELRSLLYLGASDPLPSDMDNFASLDTVTNVVTFKPVVVDTQEAEEKKIPVHEVMGNALAYAKELESII